MRCRSRGARCLVLVLVVGFALPGALRGQQGKVQFDNRTSKKLDTKVDEYPGCATPLLSKSVCETYAAVGEHTLSVSDGSGWSQSTRLLVEVDRTVRWTIEEKDGLGLLAVSGAPCITGGDSKDGDLVKWRFSNSCREEHVVQTCGVYRDGRARLDNRSVQPGSTVSYEWVSAPDNPIERTWWEEDPSRGCNFSEALRE
jgi:hypothetical protein